MLVDGLEQSFEGDDRFVVVCADQDVALAPGMPFSIGAGPENQGGRLGDGGKMGRASFRGDE